MASNNLSTFTSLRLAKVIRNLKKAIIPSENSNPRPKQAEKNLTELEKQSKNSKPKIKN